MTKTFFFSDFSNNIKISSKNLFKYLFRLELDFFPLSVLFKIICLKIIIHLVRLIRKLVFST